ncbi:MAG: hypothetical protein RLZZ450_7228 [Pseudomonadota bacterium]
MRHGSFVSIMSTLLLSIAGCAGPAHVRQTVSRPRVASSAARVRAREKAREQADDNAEGTGKSSAQASRGEPRASSTGTRKSTPAGARDAKAYDAPDVQEETPAADLFAGTDTAAPTDVETERKTEAVDVAGIEGTMTEYDVRSTLEGRNEDFDRCHDSNGNGGGKIVFRIHVNADGNVGDVKTHRLSGHNRKLIDCYSDVVAASHFSPPHGGYADVKWTTKVGRSPKNPTESFERRVRWDTPATGGATSRDDSSESRRERRRARRHRKGV